MENKERIVFEQLPEIAKILNVVTYSEALGFYHGAALNNNHMVAYINGAGMAWQAAKARVENEWISVKDKTPPTDETVLVCWDYHPDVEPEKEYMTLDEDLNEYWPNCEVVPPTHWKLIPKPPKIKVKMQDLKVGDLVKPIDHRYTLASGCSRYPHAFVVSINPFQLMSEEGDMYWRCTVEAKGYELIDSLQKLPEKVVQRMIREGLITPNEAQVANHD